MLIEPHMSMDELNALENTVLILKKNVKNMEDKLS
jgi:hypothetical protein